MWRNLCPDLPRSLLAGASAGVLLVLTTAWSQVAVIGAGAIAGLVFLRGGTRPEGRQDAPPGGAWAQPGGAPTLPGGAVALGLFLVLLVSLPALARTTNSARLGVVDSFYRTGALVFGGGHVVLPLLEREVVVPGAVTHDQFLAGYGAAQAVPGPLFTFSAYLGTVMSWGGSTPGGMGGGLAALGAIFLPALLVMAGALPYWERLRRRTEAQAALRGANAAVVGVLLAALYHPVGTSGLTDGPSIALAVGAFVLLQVARLPAWAVVLLAAAGGMAAGRVS
jgi:chromate transporter